MLRPGGRREDLRGFPQNADGPAELPFRRQGPLVHGPPGPHRPAGCPAILRGAPSARLRDSVTELYRGAGVRSEHFGLAVSPSDSKAWLAARPVATGHTRNCVEPRRRAPAPSRMSAWSHAPAAAHAKPRPAAQLASWLGRRRRRGRQQVDGTGKGAQGRNGRGQSAALRRRQCRQSALHDRCVRFLPGAHGQQPRIGRVSGVCEAGSAPHRRRSRAIPLASPSAISSPPSAALHATAYQDSWPGGLQGFRRQVILRGNCRSFSHRSKVQGPAALPCRHPRAARDSRNAHAR